MIRHSSSTGAPLSTWMPKLGTIEEILLDSDRRGVAASRCRGDSLLTRAAKKNHDGNALCMDTDRRAVKI